MSVGQGLPKTLAQAKRLLVVLVGAAVGAAVLTALLVVTGLIEAVPPTELRSVNLTLAPWLVVGVVIFVHLAFVGTVYVFFAKKLRKKVGQARDGWGDLPNAAKAFLAGLPFAVVAALSVVATDALAYSLSVAVRLVVPTVVWFVVTVGAFVHLRSADELRSLLRRLATGSLVGAALAIVAILLDRVVDGLTLQGYVPLAVLLVTAPVVSVVLVRSAQREDGGYLSALLVKTGFAQARQLQTLTVSLAVGLLVAAVAGLVVSFAGGGLLPTLVAVLVVWVATTYLLLRWFQRTDVAHSDLVIVDVRARSSGDRREVAVTNQRDERVDLRSAKIRDTGHDLYRTNIEVILAPGQTETFDVPPGFSLFPSTDDLATDLPLGFSLSKHADAPIIVTRDGEKFKLSWGEGVVEAAQQGTAHQQPGAAPDPEGVEENA